MKVILADDDPVVRVALGRLLEDRGWDVVRVGDGPTALLELQTRGADLLVTDLQMPGMDGLALADAARAVDPGLSILFVSGCARDVCYDRSGFLPKPVTAAALDEALPRVLTGSRPAPSRGSSRSPAQSR